MYLNKYMYIVLVYPSSLGYSLRASTGRLKIFDIVVQFVHVCTWFVWSCTVHVHCNVYLQRISPKHGQISGIKTHQRVSLKEI